MSVIRRFARPYARAIIDAAGSAQKANELRGELMRFEAAMNTSAELRELYLNPAIDEATKIRLTDSLAAKMKMSDLGKKTLEVLVRFHRINDLSAILAAVAAYVNSALGVAVAEVRSAKSLSPDEIQQLADTLSKKTGKKVELDIKTDPALLGGFVARIGSEIWDASVAGKITKFKESLT
jgi:F-type H+-transporting ATPase subunit delta